jgi:DNA-binding NarL/FixJ family response regulator
VTDRPRIVLIDDHPVVALGLSHVDSPVDVLASFARVEDYLQSPDPGAQVVLLDLQLDPAGATGTRAIRLLLDHGRGPVVVYTSLAEDMLLAACLAAGALGAVTKAAPPAILRDVVDKAAAGTTWVDPLVAGALRRLAEGRHAGALSPQQANALRYRGQGLTQRAIAERIGVRDPEIVNKYLRAAVEKLGDEYESSADRHPGAVIDDLARRTGLGLGLVSDGDLRRRRPTRPGDGQQDP